VLDEIDKLVFKTVTNVLYHLTTLTRILKNAKMSIIGISNDSKFTGIARSTGPDRLGEERMVFPPYNPRSFWTYSSREAGWHSEEDSLDEPVISLCAAFAPGAWDARRALDLLRVSGELADGSVAQR